MIVAFAVAIVAVLRGSRCSRRENDRENDQ
jgi:hypothetical protein